jgi:hypothetical protein
VAKASAASAAMRATLPSAGGRERQRLGLSQVLHQFRSRQFST